MSAMMHKAPVVVALLLGTLTACGSPSTNVSQTAPQAAPTSEQAERDAEIIGSIPAADWDRPLDGPAVSSLAEAQENLPFQARMPKGLGNPATILLSKRAEPGNVGRGVAFLFDVPGAGRIIVMELRDSSPLSEFAGATSAMVAQNTDPYQHGRYDAITIKNGVPARLTTAAVGYFTVEWREGDRYMQITGPDVSRDAILNMAEAA
jgi:hypothetical protein